MNNKCCETDGAVRMRAARRVCLEQLDLRNRQMGRIAVHQHRFSLSCCCAGREYPHVTYLAARLLQLTLKLQQPVRGPRAKRECVGKPARKRATHAATRNGVSALLQHARTHALPLRVAHTRTHTPSSSERTWQRKQCTRVLSTHPEEAPTRSSAVLCRLFAGEKAASSRKSSRLNAASPSAPSCSAKASAAVACSARPSPSAARARKGVRSAREREDADAPSARGRGKARRNARVRRTAAHMHVPCARRAWRLSGVERLVHGVKKKRHGTLCRSYVFCGQG